jgi:myo-inositol-1(or 4)-monophosphatase
MSDPSETPEAWLRTALEAADAAADVHLRWAGRVGVGEARRKAAADFVSHVDEEAQRAALAVIRRYHPDHVVLAEEDEGGLELVDGERPCWVVDPLDGTTNFLHGHPAYAASVAVAVGGRPQAGVVACASTGERWWAARGGGAWKNGRPIRVSAVDSLDDALVGTGFPFKRPGEADGYAAELVRVIQGTSGARRGGAAAIDLSYVAEGRFDLFWERFLNPWDFAAGALVIEEAGGTIDRIEGNGLPLAPGTVLAANATALRDAFRTLLRGS